MLFRSAACVLAGGLFAANLRAEDTLHEKLRHSGSYDRNPSKIYTGKSPFIVGETKAEPAPAPTPKAVKPAPATAPRVDYSSSETCGGLVRLVKKAPASVSLGDTFSYDLTATAQCVTRRTW